ncbi:hypothetical protein L0222_31565 [bacterium]|nr:hypothetical protein [bacterium]MCI0606807.1 hypothetical protein [bacterium]
MKNKSLAVTGTSMISSLLVLISSACCVGPLAVVLSFVGLGSSTLLSIENVVGPFRPVILSLTAVFLAGGFFFGYRPLKEGCELGPGKICSDSHSRKLQRILLWIATSLFFVLLYFTYIHPNLDIYFGIY